ncbi:hypothetical protein O181_077493, partial [Austropuccinia psidii MF-1]|nr:hypothetical protein [Austropuccinia psidii MF-1]
MNNSDPVNDLRKSIPTLTEENYPEWRLRISIYLRQKKLLTYCNNPITPALDTTKPTKSESDDLDASNEACALITSTLDSRTFAELVNEETSQNSHELWRRINERFASSSFNSKARVWSRFLKVVYQNDLRTFISECRRCLNEISSVGLEVGDIILAFTILTKLPEEFQPLIEKITLNAEQQGNPDNVLKTLHEMVLKGEALSNEPSKTIALNCETFPSKTVHYCANGKHNPLVKSHGPEKCWQLHPELRQERRTREARSNFTVARALLTLKENKLTTTSLVLDTGASNHMFNDKRFFSSIKSCSTKISTGCNSSSLKAEAIGTVKITDRKGKTWILRNSLYVPALTTNLLSLTNLAASETRIKKEKGHHEVYLDQESKPAFICSITNSVLETKIRLPTNQCYHTKLNDQPWHDRLGHMNTAGVAKLVNCQKENVHLDLCGPIATPTISGSQYFMIIIDQFRKFISVKLLRRKSEAFNHFKEFKNAAENLHSTKIKRIISDGGGDSRTTPSNNSVLKAVSNTASVQPTPPNTMVYRREETDQSLKKRGEKKTPFENWHHEKPPLRHLRPFGCKAWIRIPPQLRTHKFAPVSWEGIFLGYENNGSSYRILRSRDQAVVISRKDNEPNAMTQSESNTEQVDQPSEEAEDPESPSETLEAPPSRIRVIGPRHPTLISSDIDTANILSYRRRPRTNLTQIKENETPRSYNEALSGPNKERWEVAIQTKLDNMEKLKVCTPRPKSGDDKPITCTWAFRIKKNSTGKPTEYKARLCAQGFRQIPGVDYQHTFSPTSRLSSLRTLISFAASNQYQFHQMDVKSAFLNAPIEDNIAIEVPQGLALNKTSHVLQLNKALYGLKQSPLAWHNHLSKWLKSVNFSQSVSDPCVFWKSDPDPIWIYIHVDDLALFGPNIDPFKKLIQEHFEMKDLGEANLLLGITVHHLQNGFSLSQAHYINELAETFNISELTPSNTPLKPHLQLLPASDEEIKEFEDTGINYRSAVGSLNYISSNTRPDITFA